MQRPPVYFHFPESSISFLQRGKVKSIVARIFETEGKKLTRLDYVFCSDQYLLELNKKWLQHDTYTDILTFDLSATRGGVVGEVYLSTDRIRENSKLYSTSLQDEIMRVIVHGALHLCGHKDKTKAQQHKMRKEEDLWLSRLKRST